MNISVAFQTVMPAIASYLELVLVSENPLRTSHLCEFSVCRSLFDAIDGLCCSHEYQNDAVSRVEKKSKTQKPVIPAKRLDEAASYVHSQGQCDCCQYEHDTTHDDRGYWIESILVDVRVHLRRPMHLDLLNGICLTARKGVGGSKVDGGAAKKLGYDSA
jgi:hypothetical protein